MLGDGKNHMFDVQVVDSQSDTNRASQVAGDLINNTKVDLVMAAATGDTVAPVADMCEGSGMPCLSIDVPVEVFVFQRGGAPDKPFKWTYNLFWGLTEQQTVEWDMFSQVQTNKKIAAIWPNSGPGNAYRQAYGGSKDWPAKGYTFVDGGTYVQPSEDFTKQITEFKKQGCEIAQGVMIDPTGTPSPNRPHSRASNPRSWRGSSPPCSRPAWSRTANWPTGTAACSGSIPPSRSSRR